MDIVTLALAKNFTKQIAASGIVSVSVDETSEGTFIVVVYKLQDQSTTTIRYAIPTITGRGIANTVLNADYTLTITYTDGTSYTTPSIRGEKGEKGEKGDPGTNQVSVSPTGTSTNEVNYITIDGVESKLAGGSDVSVSASGTSTNDVRYITIDGTESRFASVALREMKAEWKGTDSAATNITTATAASRILSDPTVIAGDGFLGTVKWKDLPASLQQAEVKAFVLKKDSSQQIVQFECTSSSAAPYAWFFNSYSGQGWQSYVPLNNTVTSTSTNAALTANMGKELQDQVNNLKNIGRFLAIWNSATGLPLTDPVQSGTYEYRTGDYFRVGVVSSATPAVNYKPNGSSYTPGTASTTVETESVEVGWVYYYDGSQWLAQSAGGGGTVQDVQINGTTIVNSGTGIANIPIAGGSILGVVKVSSSGTAGIGNNNGSLSIVKATDGNLIAKTNLYSPVVAANLDIAIREGLGNNALTWTDQYKTNARTTIGAIALQSYDSTATPEDNVLYYVAE